MRYVIRGSVDERGAGPPRSRDGRRGFRVAGLVAATRPRSRPARGRARQRRAATGAQPERADLPVLRRKAATLNPHEIQADDLAMQGWAAVFRGLAPENVREAARLFDQAVERDPRSTEAWVVWPTSIASVLRTAGCPIVRPPCAGPSKRWSACAGSTRTTSSRCSPGKASRPAAAIGASCSQSRIPPSSGFQAMRRAWAIARQR